MCIEYDKSFSDISYLNSHMRTHRGEKPFKCIECDKAFSNSSFQFSHGNTVMKNLFSLLSVTNHFQTLPISNFILEYILCIECDKSLSFSDIFYPNSHMRTHRGETPFKSMKCDKAF